MSSSNSCPCMQQIRCSAPLSFLSHSQFIRVVRRAPFLLLAVISLLFLTVAPQCIKAETETYTVSQYTLASCNNTQCASAVSGWDNSTNFFPVRTAADDLQIWDVYYSNAYKIVELPSTGEQYILYECGTAKPAVGDVSVQYIQFSSGGQQSTGNLTVEIRSDAKFFKVPLQAVCVLGSSDFTYLELLGVRGKIYAIDANYVASPCLQVMVTRGLIQSIDDPYNYYGKLPGEESPCDAILNIGNGPSSDPRAITFPATADSSLLDRAEYLEYLALFFNREAIANSLMSAIRSRFTQYAAQAQLQPVSPLSAWIQYASYLPVGQQYYFDTTPYKLELLVKAGTIPYIPKTTSYATPQALMALLRVAGVSFVLDETYFGPPYANITNFANTWALNATDLNPATSRFAFIRQQQVWRNDKSINRNSADDWYESGVPNVDAVLYDFTTAVFPAIDPTYSQIWLRNIATGQKVLDTIETCLNYDFLYATVPLMTNPSTLTAAAFGGCPAWYSDPRLYSAGGNSNSNGTGAISSAHTSARISPFVLLLSVLLTAALYNNRHM